MPTTNEFRTGSAIAKAYNLIADGKQRTYTSVRASLKKSKVIAPYATLLRLDRVLQATTGQSVVFSKRTDTCQLVKSVSKSKTKTASKPVAKKAPAKPVAKKPTPKPTAKKTVAKKPTPKPVAVAAGNVDDDDLIEE